MNIVEMAKINPATKTCPTFSSVVDADLVSRIYTKTPVLNAHGGTKSDVKLATLFHMTNDAEHFVSAREAQALGGSLIGAEWKLPDGATLLPLYEAKMFSVFDHRFGSYELGNLADTRALPRTKLEQYVDPSFRSLPRFWVREDEVADRLSKLGWNMGWVIGYRLLSNATNLSRLICSPLPRCAPGNSIGVIIPSAGNDTRQFAALVANMSCLVLDYVVRQKVAGTNLNFFYVRQFPVIPKNYCPDAVLDRLREYVLELTYTATDMVSFAKDLGYSGGVFGWNLDRRAFLKAEVDAIFARLYGLTRGDLQYVLDPSEVYGDDFPSENLRVMKGNEIRQFGEYRTKQLVLAAWERFEQDGTFRSIDSSIASLTAASVA